MLGGAGEQSELFARIDHWNQEVVETLQQGSTRQSGSQKYKHHMKLRSRDTRPVLAEVSGNPYSRKRKASATMADTPSRNYGKKVTDEKVEEAVRRPGRPAKNSKIYDNGEEGSDHPLPRRRGRPAKNGEPTDSHDSSLPIRPQFPPGMSRRDSASPSKDNSSPSKRVQITLKKLISEAAIDMNYLNRCNPAVQLTNFRELKQAHKSISSLVRDLFEKLQDVPLGLIPIALEHEYKQDANTPRKSKEPHSRSYFLDREKTPFPSECLSRMKSTADKVLGKAQRAQSQHAHERQWGALVNHLLFEVEIWQKEPEQIVVLNVETCSIQPLDVRPKRPSPDGNNPIDCDAQTVTSDSKIKTPPENVGRMIDWCLALNVDQDDMEVIMKAFAKTADYATSLNQTFSYIRNNPLILDIEIKKVLQPRDPQIQLAIWASSALVKKRLMGWDTGLPMPAVAINGHSWDYYIFFEVGGNLMMAGPYPFGTTATLNGIWAIFYRLHIIMEWGVTTYKQWFKKHVMAWAQQVVREDA